MMMQYQQHVEKGGDASAPDAGPVAPQSFLERRKCIEITPGSFTAAPISR
jgi:hypothetical protein